MTLFIISGILTITVGFMIYQAIASHRWHNQHRGEEVISHSEHFYAYFFYFNPDDNRILVPKRSGGGFTLNFANPFSVISALIFVGCLIAIIMLQA